MGGKRKREIDEEGLEYTYKELSIPRNELRLLSLKPGLFDDELQCTLRNVSLDENPEYHALSYTWGDPANTKPVFIDGCIFQITVNLYDALQHFRDPIDVRTFWIDALCINQNDLLERSKQVLRMRDIYYKADRVEGWIGKADEDDYKAIELVQHLRDAVPNPEELLSEAWVISYHDLFIPLFQNCTPELLKALNCLYRRPWWTRVWVVQEVSLANQSKARVTCGRKTLRWVDFLIAAYAIEECWLEINTIIWDKFPDEPLDSFSHGIRLSQCRRIRDSDPPFTLLELLHQHRDCVATDPRDYVYGLLGMSGDGHEMGIEPDYKLSPQMIYSDLVVKYVNATGSLDIICASRNQRNFDDLPSWVPDWSTDHIVPGICYNQRYCGGDDFPRSPLSQAEKYSSAGTSRTQIHFWEDGLHFTASGFTFGQVIALGVIDDGMKFEDIETFGRTDENGKSGSDSGIFNNWLNLILDSPNWKEIEHTYGSPQNVLDAFCRVLVAGRDGRMKRLLDVSDDTSEERYVEE